MQRMRPASIILNATYTVRVKVSDRDNGSAYIDVTIQLMDVAEPPSAPASPSVTATADTGRSLEVTWNEPTEHGSPHHRLRGSVSQVSPRHELG